MRILIILVIWSGTAMAQTYDQNIPNSNVSFRMISIPAGKFSIGARNPVDSDEAPAKEIELSAFWMEEHEVTFAEWDLYFKDNTLPQNKNIDGVTRATPQYIDLTWGMGRAAEQPTNSMSQQAAVMYCKWLYSQTGFFFRLPTEAEWEYACKAGTTAPPDLKAIAELGYSKENSGAKFHPVKEKKPNAWGVYDMLGNLSEWTIDQYDPAYYQKIAAKDPTTVPGSKYPRTTRGGSFVDDASQLRCTNRIPSDARWNQRDPQIPKSRWWMTDAMFVGFRVVRPSKQPTKEEIEAYYNQYLK